MPSSRYARGRLKEYRVKAELERRGYLVFRCAGSKPVDLIAFRRGLPPIFVEVRYGERPRKPSPEVEEKIAEVGGKYVVVLLKKGMRASEVLDSLGL